MPSKKQAGKPGATRPTRKSPAQLDGKPAAPAERKPLAATERELGGPARKAGKIATVSHTLDTAIAERLRYFAFHERVSESAVIEYALREFFKGGEDAALGDLLRQAGAALRRKW